MNEYGYGPENIKLLADILYTLLTKSGDTDKLSNTTLILYRHYLAGTTKSINLLVFSRVNELAAGRV